MATCARCKQSHFGMFDLKGGFCKSCSAELQSEEQEKKTLASERKDAGYDPSSVFLSTEQIISNASIERLGIVAAECAFGMNAFKDLFAGVRDVVGGRSAAIEKTMKDSRAVVLEELRQEAFDLGANAVIGIQFQYVELSKVGNMVLLVGTGTAVSIRQD